MAKKKKKSKGLKRRRLENLLAGQANMAPPANQGVFNSLNNLLPKGRNEQFLLGLAVGGIAAYVLSDEQIRGKLFKGAIQAYSSVMGGLAEMKEQMADLAAEVEAEQGAA
ncbi:YtxH domain-containing protein [Rhodoblastus acidophilus]|uniref:YtxH domain-containing protein n=1 Tax=Rhodoblastus acidophilus TaxID=1074 RepID=A0A6N8DQV3_RHOAC|nr:YtxH domain-containing protein [Rhodoblastus acidophilus]MCW2274851.1 hypothetical protein [Rhodoblastus acidophilus]MTV31563.1 YtxH domain-containing protein [Rhodoblastus acidophilus]